MNALRIQPMLALLLLSIALLVATIVALCIGVIWISPLELLQNGWQWLSGDRPETSTWVILNFRVPRVLLGLLVGAGLAVAGVAIQTGVRNPLADPYLLGVSSGASLGAVTLLWLAPGYFHGMPLFAASWLGAGMASLLAFCLARRNSHLAPQRLILAGVAMTYLFSAVTSFVLIHVDQNGMNGSSAFLHWSLGSLARAKWESLPIPAAAIALGSFWLVAHWRTLDCMNLGDERAAALGIQPNGVRLRLFFWSSMLVGACVGVSGPIGFVGLMVPHAVRLTMGSGHRWLLIASALGGATFLVTTDLLGRIVGGSQEFAVGILAAMCGAPFFLFLLRHSRFC